MEGLSWHVLFLLQFQLSDWIIKSPYMLPVPHLHAVETSTTWQRDKDLILCDKGEYLLPRSNGFGTEEPACDRYYTRA